MRRVVVILSSVFFERERQTLQELGVFTIHHLGTRRFERWNYGRFHQLHKFLVGGVKFTAFEERFAFFDHFHGIFSLFFCLFFFTSETVDYAVE